MELPKVCTKCDINKHILEYRFRPDINGYVSVCKECERDASKAYRDANKQSISEQRKEYRAKNKDKHLKQKRESDLKNKYGITEAEYIDILAGQNGQCAICGTSESESPKRFAVDHNHDTGEVRGVLCSSCNLGIGNLGDSPDRLLSAFRYLIERGYYGK